MANNRPIARYISFFCEYSAFFIAKKKQFDKTNCPNKFYKIQLKTNVAKVFKEYF